MKSPHVITRLDSRPGSRRGCHSSKRCLRDSMYLAFKASICSFVGFAVFSTW